MTTAFISITLNGNLLFFIFLALLGIGTGIIFYRFTLPPLPMRLRIILATLRSAALVLLLFILFEPVFHQIRTVEQLPSVAILIDNSRSITIRDSFGPRSEQVKQLLKENPFGVIEPKVNVKYYTVASSLQAAPSDLPDSLRFDGDETDIASAFSGLKEQLQRENIQAAIVISDGNYTSGKNPLYEAEALGIPFYAIGVGDTSEQKDILVGKVLMNDIAYAGTRVPVDVTIKSSGYNGDNIEVSLLDGNAIVDHTTLSLHAGTHEYHAHFTVESNEEGVKKLTVRVSDLPGEITDKNNTRTLFLKVLRSKLHILLVAGGPNPDVVAVRQALAEDSQFTVSSFVQKSPGEFFEGPLSPALTDSADCIVLIGYPTSASNTIQLDILKKAIERTKKPVLYIHGKNIDYQRLETFGTVLPFTWSAINTGEVFISAAMMEQQKMHPLVTLGDESTSEGWQQLPPIYKCQTIFRAKPGVNVLAAAKLQTSILNEPLVVVQNVNGQKSFAITGQGIWRWRLFAQGSSQTWQFLPLLFSNTVRWLTTHDEGKNVQVTPTKEIFTTAEPVEFIGQVYDERMMPVANAELTITIKRQEESYSMILNSVGNGRYEGALSSVGEGDYSYTATAEVAGKSYGTDKGAFTVGKTNVEFLDTKLNKSLLEQLTYRTGGKYYDLTNARNIGEDLSKQGGFRRKEIIHRGDTELWNWKYLAGLIIFFLGMEWFIRKSNGML